MAICGKSCSILIGSDAFEAHQFSVSLASNEIDVTAFGSGQFGDFLACSPNGTVNASFYALPSVEIGDEVSLVMAFGFETPVTWTVSAVVTGVNPTVDAKSVVDTSLSFRLIGDIAVS